MKRAGRPRREAIVGLVPREVTPIVDVGADHGHVAAALGAIATERMPHRRGRPDVPWVIADGLRPFRRVGVAIVAGMGARTIARILEAGPRPDVAVLHAQDDPPRLRTWLAANGWRIDAEVLAPEAGRYAEILRAIPGEETAPPIDVALGPRLLSGSAPHAADHFAGLLRHWEDIARRTRGTAPEVHARARAYVARIQRYLTG